MDSYEKVVARNSYEKVVIFITNGNFQCGLGQYVHDIYFRYLFIVKNHMMMFTQV